MDVHFVRHQAVGHEVATSVPQPQIRFMPYMPPSQQQSAFSIPDRLLVQRLCKMIN